MMADQFSIIGGKKCFISIFDLKNMQQSFVNFQRISIPQGMKRFERLTHFFHVWSRALFILVGHDIYQEGGFKPNLYTFYMYLVLFTFMISAIYTMAFYDWFTRLNLLGYVAVAFQLLMKIYSMRYAPIVVGLVDKLIDIFRVNESVTKYGRQEMLDRYIFFTEYLYKVGLIVYIMSASIYAVNPIYMYYEFNEIVPIAAAFLPGIDEDTRFGFSLITFFHLNVIILGVLGSACSDFSFTMVIVNVPVLGNIINDNIKELNEIVAQESPKPVVVKAKLKNILLQHQEIKDFISNLDITFFKITLVQISASVLAMSSSLFLVLMYRLVTAIGICGAFFFQIVSYCAIGLIVEVTNDRLYESLIRGDWYLMPVSEQKKYQIFMCNAQKPQALTVGGVAPLNMVTCVAIFKTIYTYLMVLLKFIA